MEYSLTNIHNMLGISSDIEVALYVHKESGHTVYITSDGEVYSGRYKKRAIHNSAKHSTAVSELYLTLHVYRFNGRQTSVALKVKELVAALFVPNIYCREFIKHLDGDRKNCKAKNLMWVATRTETYSQAELEQRTKNYSTAAKRRERNVVDKTIAYKEQIVAKLPPKIRSLSEPITQTPVKNGDVKLIVETAEQRKIRKRKEQNLRMKTNLTPVPSWVSKRKR